MKRIVLILLFLAIPWAVVEAQVSTRKIADIQQQSRRTGGSSNTNRGGTGAQDNMEPPKTGTSGRPAVDQTKGDTLNPKLRYLLGSEGIMHDQIQWRWVGKGLFREMVETPTDTNLTNFHVQNPMFRESFTNTYLGATPGPYESNIWIHRRADQDFQPFNALRAYLYMPEDALQFNTNTPFTELGYALNTSSSKAENWLDVWHVQNVLPDWSVGIRFNTIKNDGYYSNQATSTNHFSLFSDLQMERWKGTLFLNSVGGKIQESGGVTNPSFIRDTILSSSIVPMEVVGEMYNEVKGSNLDLTVQYEMGHERMYITARDTNIRDTTRYTVNDTSYNHHTDTLHYAPGDTLYRPRIETQIVERTDSIPDETGAMTIRMVADTLSLTRIDTVISTAFDTVCLALIDTILTPRDTFRVTTPLDTLKSYPSRFALSFTGQKGAHYYSDESMDNSLFDSIFLNRSGSADSIWFRKMAVEGKYIINENPRLRIIPALYAGARYLYLDYYQRVASADTTRFEFIRYPGLFIKAGIFNTNKKNRLTYNVEGSLCLIGESYRGEFSLDAAASLRLDSAALFTVDGVMSLSSTSADNHYLNRYGNHDRWNNDFLNTLNQSLNVELNHRGLHTTIGASLDITTNYLYFDTLAMPAQYTEALTVATLYAHQRLRLGHFYFDEQLYYQKVNGAASDVLSLPTLSLRSNNYYRNQFFDNVLDLSIGLDLTYTTAFFADAYRLSTMSFMNQRQEELGFPRLDFYVDFRIKRMLIFLKYEHLNSIAIQNYHLPRNYFAAYGYPIDPADFRFGIRWQFFD